MESEGGGAGVGIRGECWERVVVERRLRRKGERGYRPGQGGVWLLFHKMHEFWYAAQDFTLQ